MRIKKQVGLKERISWGCGGLADFFIMNLLLQFAMPVYNIAFGVNPVWLGVALAIPRFLDAVTDPVMGNISDNTRTRWGRRRPYVLIGGILCAVILPLLWMPPTGSETGRLWYFGIMASVYALAYTVFAVPYTALGFELTTDHKERTQVLAWRSYMGLIGAMTVPWVYKMALHPWFTGGDAGEFPEIIGARNVSLIAAFVILLMSYIPFAGCRENPASQKQHKIGLLDAIKGTLRNRPFVALMVTNLIIRVGVFTGFALTLYVNIYYVCDGDKAFAGKIAGIAGTLSTVATYLSLPTISRLAAKFGKKRMTIVTILLSLAGMMSFWVTLTPDMPYLQLTSHFVSRVGLMGAWLLIQSMVGDVCDVDELNSGLRREGMFGAVTGFTEKLSFTITSVLSGVLLSGIGFDAQVAAQSGVSADVALRLKGVFIALQSAGLFFAVFVVWLMYPVTNAMMDEVRAKLDLRHTED